MIVFFTTCYHPSIPIKLQLTCRSLHDGFNFEVLFFFGVICFEAKNIHVASNFRKCAVFSLIGNWCLQYMHIPLWMYFEFMLKYIMLKRLEIMLGDIETEFKFYVGIESKFRYMRSKKKREICWQTKCSHVKQTSWKLCFPLKCVVLSLFGWCSEIDKYITQLNNHFLRFHIYTLHTCILLKFYTIILAMPCYEQEKKGSKKKLTNNVMVNIFLIYSDRKFSMTFRLEIIEFIIE